jgi:hypothetical protein
MVEPTAVAQLLRGRARRALGERTSARRAAVSLLGPCVVLGALAWIVLQPDRLTLLHPYGQGFWWLAVEPQLLVLLVGLAFTVFVAPGLLEDLERRERD